MGRKPNYQFERQERQRLKAERLAEKAKLKREGKARSEESNPERSGPDAE
jgi:hypothetical protein